MWILEILIAINIGLLIHKHFIQKKKSQLRKEEHESTQKLLKELLAINIGYPDKIDEQLKVTEAVMIAIRDSIKVRESNLEEKEKESVHAKLL